MENYFDRSRPISEGPIQLQTHGSELAGETFSFVKLARMKQARFFASHPPVKDLNLSSTEKIYQAGPER